MKIPVISSLSALEVVRRAGYGQVMDRRASEVSYARRLGSGIYPRFHVYINSNVINLHLDQKQASYEGSSAHNGEYDGDTVEAEGNRIIEVMNRLSVADSAPSVAAEPEEKTGFFGRIFGG